MKHLIFIISLTISCLVWNYAEGRIKLTALPQREETIIRLDNPHATLVEEERILTLQAGINQVDFSWRGVHISPDSICIRILSHPDKVILLSISYPPDEDALTWQIFSTEALEERVRISYLLGGINSLMTYKAIASKDETIVNMESFLVLQNFSGEDFSQINVQLEYGKTFEQAIQYEETKKMSFLSYYNLPITKKLIFDTAELPWEPAQLSENVGIPVYYVIKNNKNSNLGASALRGGKVRIFQNDDHKGHIFLGEDETPFTPIDKEIKLYIGNSRDVVVTQYKMKDKKINIRTNTRREIILYDTDEVINVKVENFKDKPASLTLIEHIPNQWDMEKTTHKYEKTDATTIKFELMIPANGEEKVEFQYHRRNLR